MVSPWSDAPIVEVTLPSCPACGALAYVPISGKKDSDGGRTSRRVCKRCSERYIVLTLPPEFGGSKYRVS